MAGIDETETEIHRAMKPVCRTARHWTDDFATSDQLYTHAAPIPFMSLHNDLDFLISLNKDAAIGT